MTHFQKLQNIGDVSRETYELLEAFVALCTQWTQSINLVSASDANSIWERHVYDSMRIMQHIPRDTAVISDFGSGGGFPGLILAILAPWKVHLVEINQKKSAFLATVSAKLNLNTEIHTDRIESLTPWSSDVVTARALAPLSRLFELLSPFIQKTKTTLFFKGDNLKEELSDAAQNWVFSYDTYNDKKVRGGPIIEIHTLSRRKV